MDSDEITRLRWDHQQLTFWLWATKRDALDYLQRELQIREIDDDPEGWKRHDMTLALMQQSQLAVYHFVSCVGMLDPVIRRCERLFSEFRGATLVAPHLMAEGRRLRNKFEHAVGDHGYYAGGGQHRNDWLRAVGPFVFDATSTMTNASGHLIGGRLHVETVLTEVEALASLAAAVRLPSPR